MFQNQRQKCRHKLHHIKVLENIIKTCHNWWAEVTVL